MKIDLFKDYLTFDFLFEQIEELFLSLISGSRKKNHIFALCLMLYYYHTQYNGTFIQKKHYK